MFTWLTQIYKMFMLNLFFLAHLSLYIMNIKTLDIQRSIFENAQVVLGKIKRVYKQPNGKCTEWILYLTI